MVFSSPIFLFFFLPLVIAGYYLVPRWGRNLWLLLASYGFYAWGSWEFLWILFLATVVDYGLSVFVVKDDKRVAMGALMVGVALNLGLLAYFKYANFFVGEFAGALGLDASGWVRVVLPLGISFFTFQKISYLVDVYRRVVPRASSFINYALYIALFPQLIAGPIVRYELISEQIRGRGHTWDNFFKGVYLFVIGLSMKVLVADVLGGVHAEVGGANWLGLVAYSFQIYFDFAGYSMMAIGLGRMFGFRFPKNFDRPYLSRSITEFWRRWHMTLSGFLKEYVYFPLGGSRCGKGRMITNLMIVFFLTGIWHGANWTFFIWGLYFGVVIVVEKLFLLRVLEKVPVALGRLWTFVIVFLGWVLFQAENVADAWASYSGMFSEVTVLSLNWKFILTLIFAIVASFISFDFLKGLEKKIWVRVVLIVFLLINCLISVAGTSFHPFLYFRF